LYELEAAMRRTGDERPRDIDFNRLVPYLMRGVWPFLVQLVVGIPASLILVPVFFVVLIVSVALFGAMDPSLAPVGALIGYLFGFLLIFMLSFLLGIIMIPMMLRAAYHLDFGSGFDMAYVKDFLKRVGKELVIGQLFLAFSAAVLVFIGLMLCFVGVYLA